MKCSRCGFNTRDETHRCPRCGQLLVYRRDGAVGGLKKRGRPDRRKTIFSARDGIVRLRKDISDFKRVGFFVRGIAMTMDLVFVLMLTGVILLATGLFLGKATGILEGIIESEGMEFLKELLPYAKGAATVSILVPPAYFIILHFIYGQTIGKMIMGIRVFKTDGSSLSILTSTIRFFGYIISGLLLFFGFFWIIWDRERQGWHDMLADTVVIKL